MLSAGFNSDVIAGYCFSAAVTNDCFCISTTTEWTATKFFIWWCIQAMPLLPLFRFLKGSSTVQASISIWGQCLTTFQTAVFRVVIKLRRLPTTSILPSSFNSVRRGRVKLGSMYGICGYPVSVSHSRMLHGDFSV